MNKLLFSALLVLAVPRAFAAGQDGKPPATVEIVARRDAEWASYRHAYKAASMFARHTGPRPLIQAHMQIVPRVAGKSLENLRIQLAGETVALDIAVDGIGRATQPMLKQAYDEDAVLRLNRQKGQYRFSGRYSIRENASGVYGAAELRAACEQMLSAQRDSGNRVRLLGKQCVGVKFIYPLAGGAPVAFRDAGGQATALPAADAAPFDAVPVAPHKVALYRFAAWPAQGAIVAERPPLMISAVYE
jgi:hypothetical protein